MIDFNISQCPYCGDNLVHEFTGNNVSKGCVRRIDHWWLLIEDDPLWKGPYTITSNMIPYYLTVCIDMQKRINIIWYFEPDDLKMYVISEAERTELPWIEPDFTHYRKLVKRLRALLVFS